MTKHDKAKQRIVRILVDQGFPRQDAYRMLDYTLTAIQANPAECVEIVQGNLGLEWEYVSPLTQPDGPT